VKPVVRDLREGGSWTFGQWLKNGLIYHVAMLGLRLASRWSRQTRRARLAALGRWVPAVAPHLRRTALQNIARIAPQHDSASRERLVVENFSNLSMELANAIERWAGQDSAEERAGYPLFDDARRVLDEACGQGRGVVLPSAHLANWERVARGIVSAGYPFVTLVRRAYDPRLDDAVLQPLRAGVSTIARGEPGAATAVVRALRRRAILGAPMDLASRVPSVEVPFFGVLTPFPVGPATLALRTGAPIVVATWEARETDGGFVEGIGAEPIPTEGDARAVTAAIAAALERRIAAAPERWVLVHSRW
jgi:KDO2-lipid IV(A) lauroyltransferase